MRLIPLTLLLLAATVPVHAQDCELRTWPLDGATDVPPETDRVFFEPSSGGAVELSVYVDGEVVIDDLLKVESRVGREPFGPGVEVELEVDWSTSGPPDEVDCRRTIRFTTSTDPSPRSDFSDLRIDRFEVNGGRRAFMDVSGSLPGDGNQIVRIAGGLGLGSFWFVPTQEEPDFSVRQLAERSLGRPYERACVVVQTYSPTTGLQTADEECGRGCSSLPASPAPWALVLGMLAVVGRRGRRSSACAR